MRDWKYAIKGWLHPEKKIIAVKELDFDIWKIFWECPCGEKGTYLIHSAKKATKLRQKIVLDSKYSDLWQKSK